MFSVLFSKKRKLHYKSRAIKNIFLICGVFISTIIGAGFSSGREIVEFFISGGIMGMYGIVISVILFILIGWTLLKIIYKYSINSCNELIRLIFPKSSSIIFNCIVLLAMISIYTVMISGVGATLSQQFGVPHFIGSVLASAICLLIFLSDTKGMVYSMNFIAPVVILGTFAICIFTLSQGVPVFSNVSPRFILLNPVLYVGYNIITLIGVMPGLSNYVTSLRVAATSTIISVFVLGLLAVLISSCVILFNAQSLQIPMLSVASSGGKLVGIIYFVILLFSMFTTSISNGYGTIKMLCSSLKIKNYGVCAVLFVVSCFFISLMPFSQLIKYLYKFLGYVGIIELIFILYANWRIK